MQTFSFTLSATVLAPLLILGACSSDVAVIDEAENADAATADRPQSDASSGTGAQLDHGEDIHRPTALTEPASCFADFAVRSDLYYDGVTDGAVRVVVTNTADQDSEVRLTGRIVAADGGERSVALGSATLTPGASQALAFSNTEFAFTEGMAPDETARLELVADVAFADGGHEMRATEVFFSGDFVVRSFEEVQATKRQHALERGAKNPFANAGRRKPTQQELVQHEALVAAMEVVPQAQDLDTAELFPPETLAVTQEALAGLTPDVLDQAVSEAEQDLRSAAQVVSARLCFFLDATWSDDHSSQDWLTDGSAWTAQGLSVWVKPPGGASFTNYILGPYNGQPAGCTQSINIATGTADVYIQSIAFLPRGSSSSTANRHEIWGDDITGGPSGYAHQLETFDIVGSGNNYEVYWAEPTVKAVHAVATAVQVLRDYRTGVNVMNVQTNDSNGSSVSAAPADIVRIHPNHMDAQSVIIHEAGHHMMRRLMPGNYPPVVYSTGAPLCPSPPTSGSLNGTDNMSIAFTEGWATFYAAGGLNVGTGPGCSVFGGLDCDGSGFVPLALHKSQCGGPAGLGAEFDWVRQFWDLHKNNGYATLASFLVSAGTNGSWQLDNSYEELNRIADSHAINADWDSLRDFNGVNVCEQGIQSADDKVCCATSCGTCGGGGCGGRPGGSNACCVNSIVSNGQNCATNNAPCILDLNP